MREEEPITIGSEAIRYTGKSAATGAANLTGAIRGSNGTTAAFSFNFLWQSLNMLLEWIIF